MKTLIVLLFPFILLAQAQYPDTLTLTNGKKYSCLITGINDSNIEMTYLNSRNESAIFQAIDQISLELLGTVYTSENGFIKEKEYVEEYINNRNLEIKNEQLAIEDMERLALISTTNQNPGNDSGGLNRENNYVFQMNKWSFGVLLIPYYSGTIYRVVYFSGSYPPEFYTGSYGNNELNLQGQLAYSPATNFMLTLDISYSSTFSERRSETHSRNEFNEFDDGTKTTDGLYLFDFSLGMKYYFLNFFPREVNIYALAGFGKQFASVDASTEDLFPGPEPTPIIEDNLAEYLKGLNSPWHFDFGFGVEYLFNESLSLISNIRFIYASISSEYDYRYISEFETNTQSVDYSNSEFITRIGLGLNFYF